MAGITDQQIEKLLKGNHVFSYLSFSMLLMRMKMRYAGDHSPANIQLCTQEINAFLEKFKHSMSADILTLQNL